MSKSSSSSSSGVGVLSLLGVLFVALKLIGIQPVAAWSWWWVTAPFWGGLALLLLILASVGIALFLLRDK